MRIVFMGTPDFACGCLEKLMDEGFEVCGVYTKPDRPQNRGMKLCCSKVKQAAQCIKIPVYQPESFSDPEALAELRELRPDILAVVAYGKILPQSVLDIPTYGAVNIHASLLPKYRGSAPIQWAVLNGDKVTGVTSMYLAPEMDTGDIIYTDSTEISEYETSGELFDRLKVMGGELLCRTIRDIAAGTAPRIAQEHDKASYVQTLNKEMSPIDWNKSPREIIKKICGLNPWPVATAQLGGKLLKIYKGQYTDNETLAKPGEVVSADKAGIEVACGEGKTLLITQVQAAGKKRMSAGSYIQGNPIRIDKE